MSERTFYVRPENLSGDRAALDGDELRHARLTLRLKAGDEVRLVNGMGSSARAVIRSISPALAALDVLSSDVEPPPALHLTMAMGIVQGERFEWAIQKGTELGASAFVPLLTERTEVKVRGHWKRLQRLERVVISACKQCGRARFPLISEPVPLSALDPSGHDLAVFFYEAPGVASLEPVRGEVLRCLMVVGPVGGFTEKEAGEMLDRGFVAAGMGPRILRTETAAAAGAAMLQYLYGDMGERDNPKSKVQDPKSKVK